MDVDSPGNKPSKCLLKNDHTANMEGESCFVSIAINITEKCQMGTIFYRSNSDSPREGPGSGGLIWVS